VVRVSEVASYEKNSKCSTVVADSAGKRSRRRLYGPVILRYLRQCGYASQSIATRGATYFGSATSQAVYEWRSAVVRSLERVGPCDERTAIKATNKNAAATPAYLPLREWGEILPISWKASSSGSQAAAKAAVGMRGCSASPSPSVSGMPSKAAIRRGRNLAAPPPATPWSAIYVLCLQKHPSCTPSLLAFLYSLRLAGPAALLCCVCLSSDCEELFFDDCRRSLQRN
jgi:hypothetical protein